MRNFDEFPRGSAEWPNELSRRRFLKLMGASIALADATGCTRNPPEHILPYNRQPEELVPGKPQFYATALTLAGFARGVLVETHEGRPTKIEGNPQHPMSVGASDVFMQAELLTLYDPERSRGVRKAGQVSTFDAFTSEIAAAAGKWKQNGGAGLRLLTRCDFSPTFQDQVTRLLAKYPGAKWHCYEPLRSGPETALYHFDKADIVVSLGADFLCSLEAGPRYGRDFAARRRPRPSMNRLYVAESTPSLTGDMADHRIVLGPDGLEKFAHELQAGGTSTLAKAIADDLHAHAGRSIVVADDFGSAALRSLARTLNDSLGNTGVTVDYPASADGNARDLQELVQDIERGGVDTLLIIGGNPVYDAPADFEFGKLLKNISMSVHIGLYENETAAACQWHLPEAHELEAWSDARAIDGTVTIMQPMIEPLFAGLSRHEIVGTLLEEAPASSYEIVRAFWQKRHPAADFESSWRKAVHDGVLANGAPPKTTTAPAATESRQTKVGMHLLFRGDPRMFDGRFANNAWLQELPNPQTQIVWDNVALVSPATAKKLHLENGDIVDLKYRGRTARAPIWIAKGQADECVTVNLGYGRTRAGSVGNGVGFNAYVLRTFDAPWGGPGLEVVKTGERHDLVTTQQHWEMHGREQVRVGTLAEFQRDPATIARSAEPPPRNDDTLYGNYPYNGHAWGMSIDLGTCIGCGVCTIACQAENNIPVVGKEQVGMNREMHWIRVDRYHGETDLTKDETYHQPVPCMHCETAPCELVCPVAATVHSSEGLNQMVYNRCIGTRYCSNNCPYKVRRFNFLEYDANQFEQPVTRKLMRNPDVSVRSRGVMEKCTYCIQRINAVKLEAEKANRPIRDGEITPACAQACPAEAIIFGDLNDPKSRVAALRKSPLSYGLLAELNTRPRTTYLARVRNPNPELETA